MADEQRIRYQFGRFILETGRDQLRLDGELVPLQRKSFEVLRVLLVNAGNLVRKEEIQQHIWPDRKIDDTNLSQHIYTLRRILGDNPKSPSFILTIPGKGYLFNHPVVQLSPDLTNNPDQTEVDAAPTAEATPEVTPLEREPAEADAPAPPPAPLEEAEVLPVVRRGRQICWSALAKRAIIGLSLILTGSLGYHFLFGQLFLPGRKREAPLIRPLTSLQGLENRPRFSPDGNLVAFTNSGEGLGAEHLYVKQVQRGDSIQLTFGAYRDQYPAWSPDGQQIAFLRQRPGYRKLQLIVIPALGGPERPIAEVLGGLDWSPDGKYLVISDSSTQAGLPASLWLLSVDGRERRPLTVPAPDSYAYEHNPRFSPDGRSIAFIRWMNDVASDLYVFSLTDRSVRQLTFDQRQIPSLAWRANGREILFVSRRSGYITPWRISSSGGPPTLEENIPTGTFHFDIADGAGRMVFTYVLSDSLVRVASLEGRPWERDRLSVLPVHCTINSSKADHTPRFSADGSKIAYVSEQNGGEDLWKAKADGSKPVQISHFQELGVGSPRWSPDGQWIVFDRRVNRQSDIYVMREDGTDLRQITQHPLADTMPSWSPDGESIYFTSFRGGKRQIWEVARTGGEPVQVTEEEANEALASADGKYLYFTGKDDKRLHRRDLSTGREELIAELAEVEIGRFWDLTPNAIYFVSNLEKNVQRDQRLPVIYRFDLGRRKISPITTIEGVLPEWLPGLSVTPDERMIAVSYLTTLLGDIQLVENWK